MSPKYTRNTGKSWTSKDVSKLKELAKQNTPTRVIGLKLGRTENAIRSKASSIDISLKPVDQSPFKRKRYSLRKGTNSKGPRRK